jgi:ABC-type multidrug transport system fused ATPase/permease subunit
MELKENLIVNSNEIKEKHKKKEVPKDDQVNYKTSGLLSFITFSWSIKALSLSNKGTLQIESINALDTVQSTRYNIVPLQKNWEIFSSNKKSKYPLMKTLFYIHRYKILLLFLIDLCKIIMEYLNLFFFRQIILHFSSGNFKFNNDIHEIIKNMKNFDFDIYLSSFLFILTKFFNTILTNHMEFRNVMLSERITNEMTALIYEKILQSNISSNGKDEGEILSLIEVDCEKIGFLFFIGPRIVTAPIRIFISMDLLFRLFGFNFIYGILVIIFCILIIMLLQIIYLRNLKQLLIKKDERSKLVTHILHILKNIKINGLEEEFHEKVKGKRNEELSYLKKNLNIGLIRMLINSNMPLILLIVSLGSYIYINIIKLKNYNLFSANQSIKSLTEPLMVFLYF